MARLFTPKIASYYEEFFISKGVKFIKGTTLASFDFDADMKVTLPFFLVYLETKFVTILHHEALKNYCIMSTSVFI